MDAPYPFALSAFRRIQCDVADVSDLAQSGSSAGDRIHTGTWKADSGPYQAGERLQAVSYQIPPRGSVWLMHGLPQGRGV